MQCGLIDRKLHGGRSNNSDWGVPPHQPLYSFLSVPGRVSTILLALPACRQAFVSDGSATAAGCPI